ncbi:hypothetical protein IQ247_13800 [Plectonema cf. radiosum LEGE 06105]|uniref:Uncharacterized protein n=1 Tax=Plectonema cf. radiosum LEGE 06105 TaxID=945769 RepID=A0A8J7F0K3_9CYAN|nr:hypothetical protein [Plectonema radiosum]MBE9213726.1 hypothetical protein [Plectonema cf. radiosum LEGE 06105]
MESQYRRLRNLLLEVGIKPTNLMFGGLIAAALALSIPSLQKHQARIDLIRSEIKQREDVAEKLERQLSYEQRQASVANKRYESCLPVVGNQYQNGTHYFTGIKEGDKPKDKISGEHLPTGTIICDAHGNTGVIARDGSIAYLAFTGDRDLIQSRLSRFRGSQYTQPVISND